MASFRKVTCRRTKQALTLMRVAKLASGRPLLIVNHGFQFA
jgi:hypothetical protein